MRKLLFLLAACITARAAFAQVPCGTDEMHRKLMKRLPQLQHAPSNPNGRAFKVTSVADTATYDVPVVVHIIHDYGAENLTDDSIFVFFNNWAQVFMKQNPDTASVIDLFKPCIGNAKMRLHLATKDPAGNPTKGITRRQSYLTVDGEDQAKMDQWPADKYMNIWFIASISGATAYGYFPWMGSSAPYYDGAISVASVGDYMQTIPHELGHCFGLHHTWGDIGCAVDCSSTDSVDDTPPTKGHPVTFCAPTALYDTVCALGYMVHYASVTGADSLVDYPDTVNAQNIMDYTYCPRMFTIQQAERMRSVVASPLSWRHNLITPANVAAAGALDPRPDLPPTPDFIVNKAVGAGTITDLRSYFLTINHTGNFQFQNTSWNDTLSGVSWSFSNGATFPTSTSTTIVNNKFSIPGWVTVSLTATSNAGSNTLVNTTAVYAADTVPAGSTGYSQPFSSSAAIGNWPMFNYYNNPFKWQFFTGAGIGDNSCVRYRSYDTTATAALPRIKGTARGDFDDLFTPAFDLAGTTGNLFLNFYTSGASTLAGISSWDPNTLDTLEVFASISGGAQWQKIVTYDGYTLQNNGTYATEFTPTTSSAWEPRAINIPAALRTHNTFFRFRYRPGNTGNDLYLDNFNIDPFEAGVKEAISSRNSFNIFPNPATSDFKLAFRSGAEQQVSFRITDIAGKMVYSRSIEVKPYSTVLETVERTALPAAGIYLVTITIDGMHLTQKLVVNP